MAGKRQRVEPLVSAVLAERPPAVKPAEFLAVFDHVDDVFLHEYVAAHPGLLVRQHESVLVEIEGLFTGAAVFAEQDDLAAEAQQPFPGSAVWAVPGAERRAVGPESVRAGQQDEVDQPRGEPLVQFRVLPVPVPPLPCRMRRTGKPLRLLLVKRSRFGHSPADHINEHPDIPPVCHIHELFHDRPAFLGFVAVGQGAVQGVDAVVAVLHALVDRRQPDAVHAGFREMIEHLFHPAEVSGGGSGFHVDFHDDQALDPVRAGGRSAGHGFKPDFGIGQDRRNQV